MPLEEFLGQAPYALGQAAKAEKILPEFLRLTAGHYDRCPPYRRILDGLGTDLAAVRGAADLPFLPVSLFKRLDLLSVAQDEVVKTLTSSGTTGQAVSKIFLDRRTAANQQKVLARLVGDLLGPARRPLLVIDSPSVLKERRLFSARGAGILGFSIFGTDRAFALDDEMKLDAEALAVFLDKHQGRDLLLFGFTFMVWRHFYRELEQAGLKPDLSRAVLVHGGGWKKLAAEAVSPGEFKAALGRFGLTRIHDYYGLAEQTGAVHMECERGHLHASIFSDLIIRDPVTFAPRGFGRPGLVQTLSILPESYPGHSLLTEDEGVLLGEDDCPCGRRGKYFHILGRLKAAETRGCGDTYAAGLGSL
jgi:phenylacetate-coenzyme A ligase PaaK-like adenylate-forming protein